jgi:hypothetical protein
MAEALDAFDPDVVHVVNPILMGAHALQQVTGRYPVVASFHTDVAAYAARYHLGWTRPNLHTITRKAYPRADRRLATSATGLARLAELGVDDASIWPPGVDERQFVTAGLHEGPDTRRMATRPDEPASSSVLENLTISSATIVDEALGSQVRQRCGSASLRSSRD